MRIISFYHKNIPDEIVQAQKAVFEHFGLPLEQYPVAVSHGEAIDAWLNWTSEWQEVTIFDIDCIPLHSEVVLNAYNIIKNGNTLYGGAQKANHIPDSENYVAPAFCSFTREVWEKAGRITFKDTQWHDVGSFFTSECKRNGVSIQMLFPTHVEIPKWKLNSAPDFGTGTTWGDEVYHAFEIRYNEDARRWFLNKCKEVINGTN